MMSAKDEGTLTWAKEHPEAFVKLLKDVDDIMERYKEYAHVPKANFTEGMRMSPNHLTGVEVVSTHASFLDDAHPKVEFSYSKAPGFY